MDTNEKIRSNAPEDVIVLGIASVETKGNAGVGESGGIGTPMIVGISED